MSKNTDNGLHETSTASSNFYSCAFEVNTNALLVIDENMRLLQANRAFERLFEISRQDLTKEQEHPSVFFNKLIAEIAKQQQHRLAKPDTFPDHYIMKLDGKNNEILTLYVSVTTLPDKKYLISLNNLEETVLQSMDDHYFANKIANIEILKTTSELAACVGHEIRNPMTSIRGFMQMLGQKPEFAKHKNYFDLMIEELDRANTIINEYLIIARNKPSKTKIENLNQIILKIFPLLNTSVSIQNQMIVTELGDLPDFMINGKQIRQMILNLVRNGLEAMPSGGEMKIKTFMTDESTVTLAISDQGSGIPPEVLDKIGQPYFTTKDTGTGLGVAVCYRIAKEHNATIEIDSSSKGTTFFIHFKLAKTSS